MAKETKLKLMEIAYLGAIASVNADVGSGTKLSDLAKSYGLPIGADWANVVYEEAKEQYGVLLKVLADNTAWPDPPDDEPPNVPSPGKGPTPTKGIVP